MIKNIKVIINIISTYIDKFYYYIYVSKIYKHCIYELETYSYIKVFLS